MTTLRRFCAALGWPRLRRWSEAIERTREAERPAAAATEPEGEFHLKVMWAASVDDSGGKHPPSKSGVGWIKGICHDPRLAIPNVWIEPKRVGSDVYETLYFVAPIADVGGRLAVVNGTALGSKGDYALPTIAPQEGDGVLMRAAARRRSIGHHIGVWCAVADEPYVLHCLRGVGSIFHPIRALRCRALELEGVYRWL